MKETLLDLPEMNEESSVRSMESIYCSGKSLGLDEKRMNSLDPVASSADNNEKSSNSNDCETPSKIRSAESRCSFGKVDDLEERHVNSLEHFPISTLGNEKSSNSVALETPEIRSAASRCSTERRCPTEKDDDMEESGENSSNLVTSATVVEVRCTETECFPVDKMKLNAPDSVSGPCVAIDMEEDEGAFHNVSLNGEEICRICHLSSDHQQDVADFINLGCSCKGELGMAHRHCAETWFRRKGNRQCEICGQCAKNITEREDRFVGWWWIDRGTMETDRRTVETDRGTMETDASLSSERTRCWRLQPVCNFLLVCLLLAFVLPWLYRVKII
ncbi:hypothetical protein MRB53_035892 [Persea americana]|uniref:Uncharacterized protein n=1 Tax=Persea americana TaxID=3435 RepID=A0ACC2K5Y4_PERAE|nr:hypothetical protein MRB53_035892 [Persea americana]